MATSRKSARGARTAAAAAAALALAVCGGCGPRESAAPAVVFVVLDNVRADHLSLCGYERPTSPVLERLRADGWASTCRAYAPGSWTLPSHASFFTGLEVPGHGAHGSDRAPALFSWGGNAHPLGPRPATLAETLARRGYRTVSVSANPVVSEVTGLVRGFDVARVAPRFGAWYGRSLVDEVTRTLERDARGSAPLFLFVNVSDAHTPWWPVPEGLGWLPARAGLSFQVEPGNAWVQFVNGELAPDAAARLLARYRDVYDYGIFRADRTLGWLLEALAKGGWLTSRTRLVVTSDHGEYLGEHQIVGHCCAPFEPDARVPLLFRPAVPGEALPEPLSATTSFFLARDGRLPSPPLPVRMVAEPSLTWQKVSERLGHAIWAASWRDRQKLVWRDGVTSLFDLERDPQELEPRHAAEDGDRAALEAFAGRAMTSVRRPPSADRELYEKLRALGYVH